MSDTGLYVFTPLLWYYPTLRIRETGAKESTRPCFDTGIMFSSMMPTNHWRLRMPGRGFDTASWILVKFSWCSLGFVPPSPIWTIDFPTSSCHRKVKLVYLFFNVDKTLKDVIKCDFSLKYVIHFFFVTFASLFTSLHFFGEYNLHRAHTVGVNPGFALNTSLT